MAVMDMEPKTNTIINNIRPLPENILILLLLNVIDTDEAELWLFPPNLQHTNIFPTVSTSLLPTVLLHPPLTKTVLFLLLFLSRCCCLGLLRTLYTIFRSLSRQTAHEEQHEELVSKTAST
jgi:hypothetical protein